MSKKHNDLSHAMVEIGLWKKRMLTSGPSAYKESVIEGPLHTPECKTAIKMYMYLTKEWE